MLKRLLPRRGAPERAASRPPESDAVIRTFVRLLDAVAPKKKPARPKRRRSS